MIAGALIHLVFALKSHTADEAVWTATITAVLTGVGLIVAGDASQSAAAHAKSQAQIVGIQKAVELVPQAIDGHNTETIKKAVAEIPPPVNPPVAPPPATP